MREMLSAERIYLQKLLAQLPGTFKRGLEFSSNALVMFSAFLLILVIGWLGIVKVTSLFVNLDYGWGSTSAPWIILACASASFIYALKSSITWFSQWENLRPLVIKDLADNEVTEERIAVIDAKRFQEPEHEGFIYFLRSSDDRVFVIYDAESQELAIDGDDPLSSTFQIHQHVCIVNAPNSGLVISQTFSGDIIEIKTTCDMNSDPKYWPENSTWCTIQWSELESHFSRRFPVAVSKK